MQTFKSEDKIIGGIIILLVAVFLSLLFGLIGLRMLFWVFVLPVPVYLILSNFEMEEMDKIIFSFFLGIVIFPSLTYWLGFLISFRVSIIIVFSSLILASYGIHKLKSKSK